MNPEINSSISRQHNMKRKCNDNEEEGNEPSVSFFTKKHPWAGVEKSKTASIAESKNICYNKTLTDLPNEILEKIFVMLSFDDLFILECVNKSFRKYIVKVEWPKIDTFNHETIIRNTNYPRLTVDQAKDGMCQGTRRHNIIKKSVKAILLRTNIKHLDVSYYWQTATKNVCSLISIAPQLISLNLSYIILEKKHLITIAKNCPLLEEISLEGSNIDDEMEEGLEQIFEKCSNLKYLNLADNEDFQGFCFQTIPPNLLYLNISNCIIITHEAMNFLAERTKNIETLVLANTSQYIGDWNEWLNNFKNLRFLQFSDYEATWPMHFPNLKKLEVLCLKENGFCSDETLETLKYCGKLKALDLSGNTQIESLNAMELLGNFKALKYCNFQKVEKIERLIEFVQHLKIEYLAISGYSEGITPEILKTLITDCESLTHLECLFSNNEYETHISMALNEKNSKRKNILQLTYGVLPFKFPKCDWCEVILWKIGESSTHFIDVASQYHEEKSKKIKNVD